MKKVWGDSSVELLLSFNTHNVEHSGSTLFNHLVGTRDLLHSWGAPDDVYNAGLFHSLYDTEYYKLKSFLEKEEDQLYRDIIRTIGPAAERLVRLFGTLNRPEFEDACLNGTPTSIKDSVSGEHIQITPQDVSDLCNVLVANLVEQIKRMPDYFTFGLSGVGGDINLSKELLKLQPHLLPPACDAISKYLIRRIPYSPVEGFESPLIYKNFWSNKVLDKLNEKLIAYRNNEIPVKVQYNQWDYKVIEDSGPVLLYSLSDDKELVSDIKRELDVIYDTSTLESFECFLQLFLRGSYIPWHDDSNHTFTCNTYLNGEKWDWNWGGALLYQDKNGKTYCEFPENNKMFVQSGEFNKKNNMHHGTSILSPSSIPKITLQIFAGQ